MMPLLSYLADVPSWCANSFFGLKPWYQYLPFNLTQNPASPDYCTVNLDFTGGGAAWNQLWLIAIAVLDDLLIIAGVVALAFVLIGAFRYVTSQGEPQGIKDATGTIAGAIVGLIIAVVATDVVNYIGNVLGGTNTYNGLPEITADGNTLTLVLSIFFGVIGVVSILMIIIGGFKYITSAGDSGRVNSAKNTILWALVGLVVAALADTILTYVLVKV
jgi:hypothetical protein